MPIDGDTEAAGPSLTSISAHACAPDAIVCFHDANVIYPAIAKIVRELKQRAVRFDALKLDGLTFAIAFGGAAGARDPVVQQLAGDGDRVFLRKMKARRRRERIGHFLPPFVRPVLRAVRSVVAGR